MEMNVEKYQNEYRPQKIEEGIEYQDFICEQLSKRGIVIQNMTSRKYQYKRENLLGLEIKLDNQTEKTGRIYIETHEKAYPREEEYALAGIGRDDNSWLYGIGNYKKFYIFSKKVLRRLEKNNPDWLYHPFKDSPTSKGFCIPVEYAEKIAERIIDFAIPE